MVLAPVMVALAACVQQPAPIGAQYRGPQAPNQYQQPYQQPHQSPFIGTFVMNGGSLTLEKLPDGRIVGALVGSGLRIDVDGHEQNGQLAGTMTMNGQTAQFTASVQEPYLSILSNGKTFQLRRSAAQTAAAPPAPPPQPQPQPQPQPDRQPAPAVPAEPVAPPLAKASATGTPMADEIDGWSAKAPAKWNMLSNNGAQNPTKTAKILVRYWRGLNMRSAIARLAEELPDATAAEGNVGVLPAGNALIIELAATKSSTRWRVILIDDGREGTAEILLVVDEDFDNLRKVVDGVAHTFRFVKPNRGKIELAGTCYRHFQYSNGISVERTLGLDGMGNAQWGGFTGYVQQYKTLSGEDAGQSSGLTKADSERGVYAIKGDKLIVHWNDGRISTWSIRWNNGRVGFLTQGGDGFVKCD